MSYYKNMLFPKFNILLKIFFFLYKLIHKSESKI